MRIAAEYRFANPEATWDQIAAHVGVSSVSLWRWRSTEQWEITTREVASEYNPDLAPDAIAAVRRAWKKGNPAGALDGHRRRRDHARTPAVGLAVDIPKASLRPTQATLQRRVTEFAGHGASTVMLLLQAGNRLTPSWTFLVAGDSTVLGHGQHRPARHTPTPPGVGAWVGWVHAGCRPGPGRPAAVGHVVDDRRPHALEVIAAHLRAATSAGEVPGPGSSCHRQRRGCRSCRHP
jgi:hypothetical protein